MILGYQNNIWLSFACNLCVYTNHNTTGCSLEVLNSCSNRCSIFCRYAMFYCFF
uniref:Uncharacterized protein n=1 Tax=Arundo donax TaxID=35708 RepID=A0A0A9F5L6_ARUDO